MLRCMMGWMMLVWSLTLQAALCEWQVLQQLGWQSHAQAQPLALQDAAVCQAAHLQDAQNQALLHYPSNQIDHLNHLQAALFSQASRCAFQFKVSDAVQNATRQLSLNSHYRFTALQSGWIGFSSQAKRHWQRTQSFGRRFEPKYSNSQALDVFYTGRVRTECGTGRQVAQLAMLRELFGDAAFDTAFTHEELSIGTFESLHDTDSVIQGKNQGRLFADGLGVKTAALGRQAWLGAPGMIVHVKDAAFLDDINNQAENFVVVAVSAAAQQQLQQGQGLAQFNRDNQTLWQWSQQINQVGTRYFERLLIENDAPLWRALPQQQQAIAKRMYVLLQQPFYRDFLIYVHPMGIKSVGFHMARLLDRNPRTPYSIELALHNLPTEIYTRWVNTQLQTCQ